jgi:hypothetical protein
MNEPDRYERVTRTTITLALALATGLLAIALLLSDSGLAAEKGAERGRAGVNSKNKPLDGLDGKPSKGNSSWQPRQYATDKDVGNMTGGPAKGARGFSWGVKPAQKSPLRLVKPLTTQAKPSSWAHQYELKSGRVHLYDHTFESPKHRRR